MLRPWKTILHIDFNSQTALYLQIAHAITEEIRRGRLGPGMPLPGSRVLATELGVNRKTVILAYEELISQGYLTSEQTSGTFVSDKIPENLPLYFAAKANRKGMPDHPGFSFLTRQVRSSENSYIKGSIVFNDGAPDVRLAPINALASSYRRVLMNQGRRNRLGYSEAAGNDELRMALSGMLNQDRGLATTPDNICITRGSQMALYLAAHCLIRPGDKVVVESLGYPPAWEAFRLAGAELLPVAVDEEGLCIDELEKLCGQHEIKAIYTTPHHHFPTTITLKADRRLRLLELAVKFGIAVIEDDYDHEFHYGYRPILPLASADPSGVVIYIGSLSKLIAPGLRIGYMAAPKHFIEQVISLRAVIDRQGDPILEQSIAVLIDAGEIKRHARKAQGEYELRRDAFAIMLRQKLGERISFHIPEGGMAFWVKFKGIDADLLAERCREKHLFFTPASQYCFNATEKDKVNAARLGFASLTIPELEEGVKRIQRVIELS